MDTASLSDSAIDIHEEIKGSAALVGFMINPSESRRPSADFGLSIFSPSHRLHSLPTWDTVLDQKIGIFVNEREIIPLTEELDEEMGKENLKVPLAKPVYQEPVWFTDEYGSDDETAVEIESPTATENKSITTGHSYSLQHHILDLSDARVTRAASYIEEQIKEQRVEEQNGTEYNGFLKNVLGQIRREPDRYVARVFTAITGVSFLFIVAKNLQART